MGRFARLLDTVGDKSLPVLLTALGDVPAEAIDNLDRAEHLGFIVCADEWMTLRTLRNQMVHEYVEDLAVLASALQTGHGFVPTRIGTANRLMAEIERRGWLR